MNDLQTRVDSPDTPFVDGRTPENAAETPTANGETLAEYAEKMQEIPGGNGQETSTRSHNTGQFAPGNPGGPGNPLASEVGKYRTRLFQVARESDIDKAVAAIRAVMRKGGDSARLAAARLLLDRLSGPTVEPALLARVERLEKAIFGGDVPVENGPPEPQEGQ